MGVMIIILKFKGGGGVRAFFSYLFYLFFYFLKRVEREVGKWKLATPSDYNRTKEISTNFVLRQSNPFILIFKKCTSTSHRVL